MSIPYSARFGDIYFSAEDGLAETRHVFLRGNNLPAAWLGRDRFAIAETGFGTGLNFLAAWTEFDRTAAPGQQLDYVAVEMLPLTANEIAAALQGWRDAFGGRLEKLIAAWPLRSPGFHRLHFGRVRLTLIFDDVNIALPQLFAPGGIDAWFLDGFAPAKNPQMWSETLFAEMARLSAPGSRVATFTAAGLVRRGLASAGFDVEKVRGYGRKRDMTVGRMPGTPACAPSVGKVAIIGGGLAGTSCAEALRSRGVNSVIYEESQSLASGASGNSYGLCNPRFAALRTPVSDFYANSYARIIKRNGTDNIGGALHLLNSAEKTRRFESMIGQWDWPAEAMALHDAAAASDIAGIKLSHRCLYLPHAAKISPAQLCHDYAAGTMVRTGQAVTPIRDGDGWHVDDEFYDAVILATARPGGLLGDLPLHTVRGQATLVRGNAESKGLRANLCYGGYLTTPDRDGVHLLGSTFQKWLHDTDLREQDDADNLRKLAEAVPSIGALSPIGARAGLRLASRDHVPVVGMLEKGLYVSTAHGSHGVLSSLGGAEIIADRLCGTVSSVSADSLKALAPQRFSAVP